MKIAVTAQGNELSSKVDTRFGRAKWIIVFDTETEEFKAHNNIMNLNAAQGAGIQAGRNVIESGAEVVITGNTGPNAFKTLNAGNVKVYLTGDQTVQEAIEAFRADKLQQAQQPNVEGHWT